MSEDAQFTIVFYFLIMKKNFTNFRGQQNCSS